jgi:hypothetical protein
LGSDLSNVGFWTPPVDIPVGERIIGFTAHAGDTVQFLQGFAFILGKQNDDLSWEVTNPNFSYKDIMQFETATIEQFIDGAAEGAAANCIPPIGAYDF